MVFSVGSDDLNIVQMREGAYGKQSRVKMLKEPMSVLTATTAAIADPFLTAPLMIESTNGITGKDGSVE